MEIINSFVLRKTLLENLFIPLFYYQKIYGKNLTEKMGNLLNNFRENDLKEEKTWIKIRKDFGNLFEEIEIFVKILKEGNNEENIEKMLSEMKKEGKIVEENKNYFSKFSEEINLKEMFKSIKNNFGKGEENVVDNWLKIKECFGGEEKNTSISNSIQLIRKKRHKDFSEYNMGDKVVFFIVYLGVGAWIGVIGTTFLVARIFGEIKCPVPVIHLSEINLPEMHLSEFLPQRGQNSPPPQQQQPIINPHTGRIVTDPNELAELGYQFSDPVRYDNYASHYAQQTRYRRGIKDNQKDHGYYNQQHRHRREINQKECRFNEFGNNGDSCPNISFPISFHKADKKNSIFNLTKNGCFDNLKNKNKIRKKRDIVEVVWVDCGGFIVSVWFILALIGWIVGAVFLGIYFWH